MVGRKRQAADCPAAVTEQAWGVVSVEQVCEWEWDGDLMTPAEGAMGLGWTAAEAGSDRQQRWHGGLSLNRSQTQGYPPCPSRLDASYAMKGKANWKNRSNLIRR
jgi:hypothetical protein